LRSIGRACKAARPSDLISSRVSDLAARQLLDDALPGNGLRE